MLRQKVLHVERSLRVTDRLHRRFSISHHSFVVLTAMLQIALQDRPAVTAEEGLQPVPFLRLQGAAPEQGLRLVQLGIEILRWLV